MPTLIFVTLLLASSASAQSLSATMTTSLIATQGATLTYTVVITNGTGTDLAGVAFGDVLDPNTTLVPGSLNTSPLAFADAYSALGNVPITIPAPGVLANDVDPDGVGPGLTVTANNTTSVKGGEVTITANGGFSYNPPRGFEGTDTFTYTLDDGEGFTDTGTVSVSVSGMIWFVNGAAPAGGDGRLTSPFSTLAALAAVNNGSGTNPAAGDSIFLFSGSYAGPLTLLNNQELIGQGATASIESITGLVPPTGSLALPATGGARPAITGNSGGIALSSGNLVRGLNLNNGGGTSLSGASVGALTVTEAAIANSAGVAVNLAGGALNVTLGSVAAAGGANGIRLANCTGGFTVTGDGASAQNGTGGTIQNTTGNAVHLDNVTAISLARMNINNSAANGVFGQNVNGLVLDWCSLVNNGDAVNEGGIRLGDPLAAVNGLIGTVPGGANPTRIANTLIRASSEMNVAIFNNSGTLAQLEVTNLISRDTRTRPLGADGFLFETRGAAMATVNFTGCSFSNNFTQGIQASALAQSVLAVNVNNCGFTNNNEGVVLANANDADIVFDLNGNSFFNNLATGASGAAIAVVNATTVTPAAIYSGKIRNNTIGGGGIDNHLITALLAGAGLDTLQVANNAINAASAQFSGVFVQAGETGSGNPNASVSVTGNTVSVGALGSHGIVIQSRITSTLCAEIANNVSTTLGAGLLGINVRQRDTSTFRLPGYAGGATDTAAVIAFLTGKNPGTTIGATVATGYSGGAACTLPLLAGPRDAEIPSEMVAFNGTGASRTGSPRTPALSPLRGEGVTPGVDRERGASDRVHAILTFGANNGEVDQHHAAAAQIGLPNGANDTSAAGWNPLSGDASRAPSPLNGERAGVRGGIGAERNDFYTADLSPDALPPILSAARQRWATSGLTREQLDVIDSLRFEVTDLAGWYLGASSGRVVQLDRRATGHGWFIDPTPNDDEEFAPGAATTRIDLLSAVLHEMGHNLGLADDYTPAARGDVMYGFLTPGERRLPGRGRARDAVPDTGSGMHYMFTPLNIGALPAGKSILITFRVTVASAVPPGTCIVSNQGIVTASGGISVPTDDPRTPAPLDATLTTLQVPPVATTLNATAITATSATLNASIIPGADPGGYVLIYRPSPDTGPLNGIVAGGGTLRGGCAPISVNSVALGLTPGTLYNFTVVASNFLGFAFGSDVSFTTLPPSFLQQPEDALVCAGNVATFRVTMEGSASGGFQWQRRDAGATAFQDITDATNATYTTAPVTPADQGAVFRVIFIGAGIMLTSDEAVLSVDRLSAPTIVYDFNAGLPPSTAIFGHAFVDATAGVLELNTNAPGQAGAFLTADLAPGRVVRGFAATFKARLNEGSFPPADGFSFNWAADLPHGTYALGEEGEGSGLRVCFDTWDNGGGEAPAIDVWWGTNLVARQPVSIPFLVRGPDFFDVQIRLGTDGLLDVTYACEPVFTRLSVTGYTPQMGARFGLGSRTGGAWGTHSIDDLALEIYLDPTNGVPRITSIASQSPAGLLINGTGAPNESYSIEASTDLATWTWRAEIIVNAGGVWQFFEPDIVTPPYRFYRLRAAPQFPSGLINWWRAEGNHLDSFGPYDGTPINGLGFAPGQRGEAFSLDGLGQAMQLGGVPVALPWTACFWVNRQDTPDASAALLTDPATGLKLEQWPNTRQVGFTQFGVADYYFNYIVPLDAWTHLAFVSDSSGTTLYVNGLLQEIHPATIALPRGVIGGLSGGGDRLKGFLDEVTLFNRALTPAEIQQVINTTRGP